MRDYSNFEDQVTSLVGLMMIVLCDERPRDYTLAERQLLAQAGRTHALRTDHEGRRCLTYATHIHGRGRFAIITEVVYG